MLRDLRLKVSTLARLIVLSPLFLACIIGAKQFEIWPQITYLWNAQASPLNELMILSPHSFRYAVLYPILIFSEAVGVDYNTVFTFVVLILAYKTSELIFETSRIVVPYSNYKLVSSVVITAMLLAIFSAMNGRGAIALFGYALLINTSLITLGSAKRGVSIWLRFFFSLLFCSVSSGTLAVSVVTLVLVISISVIRLSARFLVARMSMKDAYVALYGPIILVVFGAITLVGILKNLNFYGGGYEGFFEMLSHGFGSVLSPVLKQVSPNVFVLTILMVVVGVNLLIERMTFPFLIRAVLICLALGVFGYTTASMVIVPALVLVSARIQTLRFGGKSPAKLPPLDFWLEKNKSMERRDGVV